MVIHKSQQVCFSKEYIILINISHSSLFLFLYISIYIYFSDDLSNNMGKMNLDDKSNSGEIGAVRNPSLCIFIHNPNCFCES